MTRRRRSGAACAAVVLLLAVVSCGSTESDQTAPAGEGTSYCESVDALISILDDGGSVDEYDEMLAGVTETSPTGHADTWLLLLALSEQPFSYENFNPAVDSLERLDPELERSCGELGSYVVDDDGRIRSSAIG